jgi:hypothetical protein
MGSGESGCRCAAEIAPLRFGQCIVHNVAELLPLGVSDCGLQVLDFDQPLAHEHHLNMNGIAVTSGGHARAHPKTWQREIGAEVLLRLAKRSGRSMEWLLTAEEKSNKSLKGD